MQFEISDQAAVTFAQNLYEAVADGPDRGSPLSGKIDTCMGHVYFEYGMEARVAEVRTDTGELQREAQE